MEFEFNLQEENEQALNKAEENILQGDSQSDSQGGNTGNSQTAQGNTQGNAQVKSTEPLVMTDERRKLIIHIQRYKSSKLARYLDLFDLDIKSLKNMTEEELDTLLKDIQMTVSIRSSNTFNKEIFFTGVATAEPIVSSLTKSYDITGMSNILRQDPEIDDLLEEISLQNNKYTSPHMRLAMALVKSALATNMINNKKNELKNNIEKPLSDDITKKYKDL